MDLFDQRPSSQSNSSEKNIATSRISSKPFPGFVKALRLVYINAACSMINLCNSSLRCFAVLAPPSTYTVSKFSYSVCSRSKSRYSSRGNKCHHRLPREIFDRPLIAQASMIRLCKRTSTLVRKFVALEG